MCRSAHSLSLCVAVFVLLSLFSRFLFPPPLSFNPLLLCYIYSSFTVHFSVAPISFLWALCSMLCCMNVISEYPQYYCAWPDSQAGMNSVVSELLLQIGGLCKCLCHNSCCLNRWQLLTDWHACCVQFQLKNNQSTNKIDNSMRYFELVILVMNQKDHFFFTVILLLKHKPNLRETSPT